jgi:ectoine hydroxylase-related dioxygenase (phytanoyl-CoA dioxygenase family)
VITDAHAALTALGVTEADLSGAERTELDRDGFTVLKGVLSQAEVQRFSSRLDELMQIEGEQAGSEIATEEGTARLANLLEKDAIFDVCVTDGRLLAAVDHVLAGDFKLSGLNCRIALPGCGEQPMHPDWGEAVAPGSYQACNSIWCIDEFTPDNGPVKVVPGSHLLGRMPPESDDYEADAIRRQAIPVMAPAGAVIVLNAHVWHHGSLNRSAQPRRALHSYFVRRANPQQQTQRSMLSKSTLARFSPAVLLLLDAQQ